jgi:hypothetical protein
MNPEAEWIAARKKADAAKALDILRSMTTDDAFAELCQSIGEEPTWLRDARSLLASAAEKIEPAPKCGEVVIHLIAGASWFPCALNKGHDKGHRAAGNCFVHGPYLGKEDSVPECPHWPACCSNVILQPAPAENAPSESVFCKCGHHFSHHKNGACDFQGHEGEWCECEIFQPEPSKSVGAQELHEGARIVSSALLYLNHQTPKNWAAEGILNSLWGGLAKEYFETKYKPPLQQSESPAADELPPLDKASELLVYQHGYYTAASVSAFARAEIATLRQRAEYAEGLVKQWESEGK